MQNSGQAAREKLAEKLDAAGLGGITQTLTELLPPLAPVLANLLWLTQPAFALFDRYDEVGQLAETLAHPPSESERSPGSHRGSTRT